MNYGQLFFSPEKGNLYLCAMQQPIWIYTETDTPRVRYAFRLLFEHIMPMPYRLVSDKGAFVGRGSAPGLSYQLSPPDDGTAWLPANGLLWEDGVRRVEARVFRWSGVPVGFPCGEGQGCLPFDWPAWVFYLAARYEEYLPFRPDEHGRFPASGSLAAREGFLARPVLQQLARAVWPVLAQIAPGLSPSWPAYHFRPTYDIDLAWAYLHRPAWLTAGAIGKDLLTCNWQSLRQRSAVLLGQEPDPYHTFSWLEGKHRAYNLSPLYFFLLGDYGPYDKNISPSRPAYRQLLASLASSFDTGLHPSYRSNTVHGQLALEAARYYEITGQPAARSRQHYLKLRLPDTYRHLVGQGIGEDHSMGFADQPGYRAGLSVPFPWYDLGQEAELPLMVYPFPVMDATLRQYMGLSPEAAWGYLQQMIGYAREDGGNFWPLWHNSSFSSAQGWNGWAGLYERLLQYASSQ